MKKINVTERINYYSSPAIRINAQKAFDMAGIKLEDISYFDFYSCFPSAVQIACEELGLDQDDLRGLTVTGGLPFSEDQEIITQCMQSPVCCPSLGKILTILD